MSGTQATLDDLGIKKEDVAEFVNKLIEENGGLEEQALMTLYIKTATAAEILRKTLGIEPIVVTLEDVE